MLMDIIETVFDRPTISTFVLMTGDKDFTRISARLKLRLNKTVYSCWNTRNRQPGFNKQRQPICALRYRAKYYCRPARQRGYNADVAKREYRGDGCHQPGHVAPALPGSGMATPVEVLDPQFLQFLITLTATGPGALSSAFLILSATL